MPTLRDHLQAAEDAGRGGHRGGGHHGGHHGGHRRGRGHGGGVVFYDRSPDVIVVTDDCPPGFYIDEFGDCRPLPYHSMQRRPRVVRQAGAVDPKFIPSTPEGAGYLAPRFYDRPDVGNVDAASAGHFDARFRPLPPEASGDAAVPVGWFNPFDPYGSGYALNTARERANLNDLIVQTDVRVTAASGKIPQNILSDYVSFRKDWAVVNKEDIQTEQLSSMRSRFRAQLDKFAPYLKVDDLRPPPPVGKQIESAIDAFTDSTKKAGQAAQVGIVGLLVLAAVGLYVAAPHLLPFAKERGEALTKAMK